MAVATLLLLVSIACALAGWWTLDELFVPARLTMLFLLLALTPVVIGPVLTAQWAAGRAGVVQRGAAAVIALLYAVLASAALLRALDTRASQQTLGTPSGEVAGWLIAAAAAVAGLASLAAALPLPLRRMQLAGLVLVLSGAATAGVAAAAVAGARDECDAFRFERSHWREALRNPDDGPGGTSKAEDLAAAVVRCGTLDGATEAEVRRALGRPTSTWRGRLLWYVGWTNDAIGPGDAQELVVEFERDNAQARVYLAAP